MNKNDSELAGEQNMETSSSNPEEQKKLEFASSETAEVHTKIEAALAKGDFKTVADLANKALALEAKALYDKQVLVDQKNRVEKLKESVNTSLGTIVARHTLLIQEKERNPFLNPEYKATFDALVHELLDIASSDSIRKKYDFEANLNKLSENLKTKLGKMRGDGGSKFDEREDASSSVGSRVLSIESSAADLQKNFTNLKGEDIQWDAIADSLRKLV